jgi:RNA polymerase sigma factor (sigma-70 family)
MQPDPDQTICSLFQECAESLFRYAFRLTRLPEASDDLVQEAFLSLYVELRRGREMTNPRAWMLGLISHKAARIFKESRLLTTDPQTVDSLTASQSTSVPWDVSEDELIPLLDLLSPREVEVVLLRLQSLKYREIADQLGISHKSVATLLSRALAKMQQGAELIKISGENRVDWRDDDASLQ